MRRQQRNGWLAWLLLAAWLFARTAEDRLQQAETVASEALETAEEAKLTADEAYARTDRRRWSWAD